MRHIAAVLKAGISRVGNHKLLLVLGAGEILTLAAVLQPFFFITAERV